MGELTLLITGAAGYVGRYAVGAARARGHRVLAHMRNAASAPPDWQSDPLIRIVAFDLADPDAPLAAALDGVNAVIHTAATLDGDDAKHQRDTVQATTLLARAITCAQVPPHLVLLSSMAVYSGSETPAGGIIDETTLLESRPDLRDAYCRAKLLQEGEACQAARTAGFALWILRAGAVFGPRRLWNAHVGLALGPLVVRLGSAGQIPLIHVEHCADLLVRAAEITPRNTPNGAIEILNLIDDDLPDRIRFLNSLQRSGWPRIVLPLHWKLLAATGAVLGQIPVLRRHLPGLLRQPVLDARLRPHSYSNTRLRNRLNWRSPTGFETTMINAIGAETALRGVK